MLGHLALLALVAVPGATPPTRIAPPTQVERPIAVTPEQAMQPLDAWCPSGEGFTEWLESRQRLAGTSPSSVIRRAGAKSHGAEPRIELRDGVVIMEDDGSLTRFDRRFDLAGLTLEFTPSGDDYTVAVLPLDYDLDVGAQQWADTRGFVSTSINLRSFNFPFGGVDQSRVWLTSTLAASFVDPAGPGVPQLHLNDSLNNRTPRIAPLQQGSDLLGWNAFFREAPDRVLATWRASDGGGIDIDIQLHLFPDGRIRMSYRSTRGINHGSVVVIDGDAAWWNDRALGGFADDPPGDVGIPAPDGPAIDIVQVRALQVGGSELLNIEIELAAPLPAVTDGTLQFATEIREEAGGTYFTTLWAEWEDGRFNWTNTPVEVVGGGNVLRMTLNRSEIALLDDGFNVVVWTAQSWNWQEVVGADLAWPLVPPVPLLRDFSVATPAALRGPLVEAFTIPELLPYSVHDAFNRHFGSPPIDGLAIYQNFLTDIVFFAGAYSTVGNAGADGIGAGNTTDPLSPALLHMNTLWYGWNSWDEGKVTVLNHEFGHHWLYFFSIMEGGAPTKILGDGHPAGWVHTPAATPVYNPFDSSCMGGSTWTDNADGTFTSAPGFATYGYSWPELYLMGLADPVEVPDFFYLRDSNPALPGAYWPQTPQTVTATRVDVTFSQISDAMGLRNPERSVGPVEFRVPMVLVVRPSEWDQGHVDEVERTCQVWAPMFGRATIDRASVVCNRVGDRPPTVAITDPPVDLIVVEGTTLGLTGEGTDLDGDVVDLSWDFGPLAAPAIGPGPHDVLFAEPGDYIIELRGRDATGRDADMPDIRTVRVVCANPAEVSTLRVAHDRFVSLSFDWDALPIAPDEHVVLSSDVRPPAFAEVAAGATGLTVPLPPGNLVFFKVAARNLPDCLGPY